MKLSQLFVIPVLIITGCSAQPLDEFAKCLTDVGVFYFMGPDCSICNSQATVFGSSFSLISRADCSAEKELCEEVNVSQIPSWYIKGVFYPGYRSIEDLSSLTGCKLP